MKLARILSVLALLASTSSFAASAAPSFELIARTDNIDCTVSGSTVTKKISYLYGSVGFSTSKEIQSFGFDTLVEKAAMSSKGIQPSRAGYLYLLRMNGTNYGLNITDSQEAMVLMGFLNEVCDSK